MASLGRIALAALGIMAYQNRDKLSNWFKNQTEPGDENRPVDPKGGGVLGGLGDLLDQFRGAGHSDKVDSWVGSGPNAPIEPQEVKTAVDDETLGQLSAQTGMSREEILVRLSRDLPEAVNDLTPDGKLPEPGSEPSLIDTYSRGSPSVDQVTGAGPALAQHSNDARTG